VTEFSKIPHPERKHLPAYNCPARIRVFHGLRLETENVTVYRQATLPPPFGRKSVPSPSACKSCIKVTEGNLDQTTILQVAGQLERQGATGATDPVGVIESGAPGDDVGHADQADDIVDHRRLSEQAVDGQQGRLVAHDAASALDALQQHGLLAADTRRLASSCLRSAALAAIRWVYSSTISPSGISPANC